ncbi:AraC family transcriptional regulator [Shimia thalassica]|uniref:AraC family transcriptional regulator n=1 Tax=Shimia thalassica TaxID=1715693 RepID=UPI0026E2BB68|nr:AraC family transcriptional regulator [Shimia thalassica]MDO6483643.1 helix-turn-helix domain-containing protein [Shimia thalassica]
MWYQILMPDSLPATMSVAFLHPFFDELLRRGVSQSLLAARINLPESSLFDPAVTVPANSVYAFLKWVADSTGDALICASIGQHMAKGAWAPLVPLMNSATTVGDFFQKFSQMSSDQGKAAIYKLEVEGAVALWRLVRAKGASADAAFADAVAAGYFVGLLKSAARHDWDASKIIAVLPDTKLVPHDLLPSTSVLSGGTGLILRFPSAFLGFDMPRISPASDLPELTVLNMQETTLAEQVRQLIQRSISDPNLGLDSIAKGVGLSSWKLQSQLKADGMSISEIREEVRKKQAIAQVTETTDTVGSIATGLGYTNSSNFTRAFRGWTGKSPRDYRKSL